MVLELLHDFTVVIDTPIHTADKTDGTAHTQTRSQVPVKLGNKN
jgi:hypothetical protein